MQSLGKESNSYLKFYFNKTIAAANGKISFFTSFFFFLQSNFFDINPLVLNLLFTFVMYF